MHFIGLVKRDQPGQSKLVKVGKVAYYVRLLDLHRSNPFGPNTSMVINELRLPENW